MPSSLSCRYPFEIVFLFVVVDVIVVSVRSVEFMPISFTSIFAKRGYHLHFSCCWLILEFCFLRISTSSNTVFYILKMSVTFLKSSLVCAVFCVMSGAFITLPQLHCTKTSKIREKYFNGDYYMFIKRYLKGIIFIFQKKYYQITSFMWVKLNDFWDIKS